MKVYELIMELSELPAGAEVEFSTVLSDDDLANLERLNNDDGYRYATEIKDVDQIHTGLVALHG